MSYNGGEIVELLEEDGSWNKTVLRDAYFVCASLKQDEAKYIRRIEGSVDGGMIWKTRYEDEIKERLPIGAWDIMQWRVKE